jgi:Uncharacterized protein conserved in bacteria
MSTPKNVLGEPLELCSESPKTGFTRSGSCETGPQDLGSHTVCARVTQAFLEYSKSRGNDLMTPIPEFDFPGLKPGDRWCLCAARWQRRWRRAVRPGWRCGPPTSARWRSVPWRI